ncbi:hypothetical protein CAEBREN_29747 [Caenorhabditis brenneri]|uniref:Uncharacterized protein n=1 Tax=Caenorhabditis brenneri TaxID=135651 RepID=G0NHT7_CAEBE|nr:hypothetical protein CAEBREN_29747 [Caenorhabditis brenneri]
MGRCYRTSLHKNIILLLAIIFFLLVLVASIPRKTGKLPPGPTPLPLIGNIHQLVYQAWKGKGIVAALDFYRKKYGNAFTVWLGPIPAVNITNFDTAHEIFVKNGKKCVDRQLAPIFEHITGGLGILTANGEGWAEMRRFTLLAFRKLGVGGAQMEKRIMNELDGRCSELNQEISQAGRAIVPVQFFDLTVGSVINTLLVGKRFDENTKDDFLVIKKLFDDSAETFNLFDLSVPVWLLKWFFPWRYNMNLNARRTIRNHVGKEAVERLERVESGELILEEQEEPKDFVDVFLGKMREEREKDGGDDKNYNMSSLKFVLQDLWLAGQGTTATTLYVGFMLLAVHQDIIQKVRKELWKVTNNSRNLSLQDRSNTPYLNATIAEIQRHASILNVNFWRINSETIHFDGYEVAPGALMTAQLGALHVNEELFESPEKFDPERFLRDEKLIQQLIPFGIGKRSCVGEQIAKSELYLVFGNLLLRYDIKPHGPILSSYDVFPYGSAKFPDVSAKLEFTRI